MRLKIHNTATFLNVSALFLRVAFYSTVFVLISFLNSLNLGAQIMVGNLSIDSSVFVNITSLSVEGVTLTFVQNIEQEFDSSSSTEQTTETIAKVEKRPERPNSKENEVKVRPIPETAKNNQANISAKLVYKQFPHRPSVLKNSTSHQAVLSSNYSFKINCCKDFCSKLNFLINSEQSQACSNPDIYQCSEPFKRYFSTSPNGLVESEKVVLHCLHHKINDEIEFIQFIFHSSFYFQIIYNQPLTIYN